MNKDRLIKQLEHILQTAIHIEQKTVANWNALGEAEGVSNWQTSRVSENRLYIPMRMDGQSVSVLALPAQSVTESERKLIELTIAAQTTAEKKSGLRTDNEQFVGAVRQWIEERIVSGALDGQDPPAELSRHTLLYAAKVPFLLYGEYANSEGDDYAEMKKLLQSFFDGDIQLIPLMEKEWLVLGSDALLVDTDDEAESSESTEDRLASLCSGLHAVISTEGAGDCHVAAYYPIVPAQSLPSTVLKLREAISIGRLQRVGQFIHLPWELYLDQLLSPLTHADRMKFIEQVFKRTDPLLDRETIQTLETFFELDCNVSETAKKLFIHRNTLLYRLDKFKQDSGLDVRTFNQAVHVKIALQLYKVTKRL